MSFRLAGLLACSLSLSISVPVIGQDLIFDDGFEDGGPFRWSRVAGWGTGDWLVPWSTHRVRLTVNPHPTRDRVDLPVLARLEHNGSNIRRDITAFELEADWATLLSAHAWTLPGGQVPEVGFTLPGVTPAGATRQLEIYYGVSPLADPWAWHAGDWATFVIASDRLELADDTYVLSREVDPEHGHLLPWRRPGSSTFLDRTDLSWRAAEGFSTGYMLQTLSQIYPADLVENHPVAEVDVDGDAFQAALAIRIDDPLPGGIADCVILSYRIFRHWPFLEMGLTAVPTDPDSGLRFASDAWNARKVELLDPFDRMVSSSRGDEPMQPIWDTTMRWLTTYRTDTDAGFGWFIFEPGVLRAEGDGQISRIYDSYGYSSGHTAVQQNLWAAAADKDDLIDLFDAMQPGVTMEPPEARDLNIRDPEDGRYFFPEDRLDINISTPGNNAIVVAWWDLPDGSRIDVELERSPHPLIWTWPTAIVLDEGHPTGIWTLTATTAGISEEISINVQHAQHPRLLFSAEDLQEIRARKDQVNTLYPEIWADLLFDAEDVVTATQHPTPEPGIWDDIRKYGPSLQTLALTQLIEDQGQTYHDRMVELMLGMLRYPNWLAVDPDQQFNNHDLTGGHFLSAIALTYDWHYDRLTPTQRAEIRQRLATYADVWIDSFWMRHYPQMDWPLFGKVTNNHYWINNTGVLAVALVLKNEVAEDRRLAWLNRTEANLTSVLDVLEDDGASHEGIPYHSYGLFELGVWLDMRDREFGGNTALTIPWFANAVDYDVYGITPGGVDNYGGVARFGDAPAAHYRPPKSLHAWLARRIGDGRSAWFEEHLDWHQYQMLSWARYLWHDPSIEQTPPSDGATWHLFPNKGIFVWRSSWEDNAAYFSLKSGSYFGGHEHPDAGHFIVERAGVPYITDHGYSWHKRTDEHNVLLIDGTGQRGVIDHPPPYTQAGMWMDPVDPQYWARIDLILGHQAYFDVIADPTPMYLSDDLHTWSREVIGLTPGIFIIADQIETHVPTQITWLLHSYASEAELSVAHTYSYWPCREQNPWTTISSTHWTTQPRPGNPNFHLVDLSADSWSTVVEPSLFVPNVNPDSGHHNLDLDMFQLGGRIRRDLHTAQTTSLVAMWFGDLTSAQRLDGVDGEGVAIFLGGNLSTSVIWPNAGTVNGFHGFDVHGAMGGRRLDQSAYFGRQLTHLADQGLLLAHSDWPIDVFARLEHTPTAQEPLIAKISSADETDVTLYCTHQPSQVLLDGNPIPFTWAAENLNCHVPPGNHVLEVSPMTAD